MSFVFSDGLLGFEMRIRYLFAYICKHTHTHTLRVLAGLVFDNAGPKPKLPSLACSLNKSDFKSVLFACR